MRSMLRLPGIILLVAMLALPSVAQAAIYPGPKGSRDVHGAIEQEWLRLNAVPGFRPGQPLTNETATAKPGAFNNFTNGSIYWSPSTGAHEVHGAFYGYWAGQNWENGALGFPVTGELQATGGVYQKFQGGILYWSSTTGAHQVHGSFYELWASLGWERSYLGFPTGEESPAVGGVFQHYQGATLYWSPATGAHAVHGAFYDSWAAQDWERGGLGYPTGEEIPTTVGVYQNYQGATLTWSTFDGVVRRSKVAYANCANVWDTIDAPLYAGQQGYSRDLDGDGDGVGCQIDPRSGPHLSTGSEKSFNVESYMPGDLDSAQAATRLQELKDVGANTATLVVELSQADKYANEVGPGARTPTDDVLTRAVQRLHKLGLRVKIAVHDDAPQGPWRAEFQPTNRPAWFASYGRQLQHYATLCQTNGVEALSIGSEMESLTTAESAWESLIRLTRASYTGILTYDANWDNDVYPGGSVKFWSMLDEISISGYFELKAPGDVPSLMAAWAVNEPRVRRLAQNYNKPVIFGEVGYRSIHEAHLVPSSWGARGAVDEAEQARDYQALFQYWSTRPYLHGFDLWKWELGTALDPTDYTPQSKPAMNVIRQWFSPAETAEASVPSVAILYPTSGSQVSGVVRLEARVLGRVVDVLPVNWRVDGGEANPMTLGDNSFWHADIDVSGWDWQSGGQYRVTVCALPAPTTQDICADSIWNKH